MSSSDESHTPSISRAPSVGNTSTVSHTPSVGIAPMLNEACSHVTTNIVHGERDSGTDIPALDDDDGMLE